MAAVGAGPAAAAGPVEVRVLPWPAGAQAALSITFDDAYPSQVGVAAPLLEAHGYRGTFYLIVDKLFGRGRYRDLPRAALEEWQAAARRGHEVGSHSWSHVHLDSIGAGQLHEELDGARQALAALFAGSAVTSLAYPFSEAGPSVRQQAGAVYATGRLGPAAPGAPAYNDPANADLLALTACFLCTDEPPATWNQTAERTASGGGWLVEALHPIDEEGYCRVRAADLAAHLDWLAAQGERLWVAPVAPVAERLRRWRQVQVQVARSADDRIELHLEPGAAAAYAWETSVDGAGLAGLELTDGQGHPVTWRAEDGRLRFAWPIGQTRLLLGPRRDTSISAATWGQVKRWVPALARPEQPLKEP